MMDKVDEVNDVVMQITDIFQTRSLTASAVGAVLAELVAAYIVLCGEHEDSEILWPRWCKLTEEVMEILRSANERAADQVRH
jgi:hypothetical protein